MKRKVLLSALLLGLLPIQLMAKTPDNIILERATACLIEKGKMVVEERYLIQINNKQGEWITDIRIPYQKNNKVRSLKGELRDAQGNVIRKLKKSDISEASYISTISLYEDDFVKKFSLKHNQYPYQISYQYKIEYDEFLHIAAWTPVLNASTPTLKAKLSVHVPQDYGVKISQKNVTALRADTVDGQIFYEWNSHYLSPVEEETHAPSRETYFPWVHIFPINFQYGLAGSQESWSAYGNWVDRLSEGLGVLPASEQGKVQQLINGIDDPRKIIQVLYNYMQDHTRYINVSIDIGGMKPYPADYVALNKYGDCKALTNYMKALLEVAKIKSYCVDVFAAENPKQIKEDLPGQQFNHVVLCVPLGNDTIWLENTSATTPAGYAGVFVQNRKGLLVNGNNSKLIQIPALSLEDVEEQQHILYTVDEQQNCTAEIKFTAGGKAFERYSSVATSLSKNQQKQFLAENLPFKNFEITSWDIHRKDRNLPQVEMTTKLKLKNFISRYENDIIITPEPISIPNFEAPEHRQLPVLINYPINKVDSMRFRFPDNMALRKYGKNYEITSSYGSYTVHFNTQGEEVQLIRRFVLNSGAYPVAEYPDFYRFLQEIKIAETKNYINLIHKEL